MMVIHCQCCRKNLTVEMPMDIYEKHYGEPMKPRATTWELPSEVLAYLAMANQHLQKGCRHHI